MRTQLWFLALGVLLLTGCKSALFDEFVEPRHDLRETKVLIPAFRDGKLYHYESQDGQRLARNVAFLMQQDCDSVLQDDGEIAAQLMTEYQDPPPWGRWGRRAGATHVVIGHIREIRFSEHRIVGMFQGKLSVRFSVFDVEKDKISYRSPPVEVTFPEDPSKEVAAVMDLSRRDVAEKLYSRAAQEISALLCGKTTSILDD